MKRQHRKALISFSAFFLVLFTTTFCPDYPSVIIFHTVYPGWQEEHGNLKIVFFSDLHLRNTTIENGYPRKLIDCINKLQPDLVLILGDIFDRSQHGRIRELKEPFVKIFSQLKSRYGIFAILGNHDVYCGKRIITELCEAAGIRMLDGNLATPVINGKPLFLYGIREYDDKRVTLLKIPEWEKRKINTLKTPLILSHRSDFFFDLDEKRPFLVLSGHTHGGLIRLPFLAGGVYDLIPNTERQQTYKKYIYGHYQQKNKQLYVTGGLDGSFHHLRVNCPPEIIVMTIKPEIK